MEAKTYYEKTLSNNDPIFDEARRIGGSLCKAVGKATWFVKDYLQCFLLSVLFDLLPVKAKKDATAGERGLNYAMSTIMALLVVGSVVQIYLLLFIVLSGGFYEIIYSKRQNSFYRRYHVLSGHARRRHLQGVSSENPSR